MREFRKESEALAGHKPLKEQTHEELFRHFQGIKLHIMRQECEAAKDYSQKDIVRSVLVLE
jgi:hypothetical protein